MMKLIIIIVMLPFGLFAAPYDPTNDLLFAFGSRCNSNGVINERAMSDGSTLKHISESIKNDPSCNGLSGALNDISSLNIPELLKDKNSQDDLEYLSMQSNDLELAIQAEQKQSTPDAEYLTVLKNELITTKVNLAKSRKNSNFDRTRKRLDTIQNFQKYSTALFSRLSQSNQCIQKNPNLSAQIGAQLLGLGSTLASGVVGALMLATGNLIDNFISYFREKDLGDKISEITNNRLGEAIGCTFEGLAHTYCQARDVETVIKMNKNKSESNVTRPNWMDGIGVMGQDAQSYIDWITKLDAGAPAGTTGRATDKKTALAAQSDLRALKIDIDGILNTAKNNISQSSNKAQATQKIVSDLAARISPMAVCSPTGCPVTGPFLEDFSADPSCGAYIYLFSKGAEKSRRAGDPGTSPCMTYIGANYTSPLNLESDIEPLIHNLMNSAETRVNILVSQVNESNPELVLSKVDNRSNNRRTAREFLNGSVAYLDNLLNDTTSIAAKKNQKELIEKTKMQIVHSLEILDKELEPVDPQNPSGPTKKVAASDKISRLSNKLIPLGDTFAIPKALSEIINQDIDHKMSRGEIDQNVAQLMQLSSNDSLGELIKYYLGLEAAKTQARSAKELTKTNITSFSQVFSKNLVNRMEKLFKDSKDDPDASESLALLCMQTLSVPESPLIGDADVKKYCSGRTYNSIYDKSGLKMNYDTLSKKPYHERVCAVYDFYRSSYLYGLKTNRNNDFLKLNSETGKK